MNLPAMPSSRSCVNLLAVAGLGIIATSAIFHQIPADSVPLVTAIATGLCALVQVGEKPSPGNPP
jgi:hypothetical protein